MSEPMDWNKILDDAEKDPGFKPVPADKYRIRVDKAEAVVAGTGADMIKVQAKIIGGPYDTKVVFTNIVFSPGNPTATKFTLRKLKGLGISEETLRAQNPPPAVIATMIQGAEAEAEVVLKPATDQYEESNDIKAFRSLVGGSAVPAAPTLPSAPSVTDIPKPTVPNAPSVPAPPPVQASAEPAAAEAAAGDEPKEPF